MLKNFVNIILSVVFLSVIASFSACSSDGNVDYTTRKIDNQQKESLEKANRYLFLKEKETINEYIERHNIDVVETGTGLCYRIVKQGDTKKIVKGDVVTMEYEVRFLTGELVYSSKEDGPKVFVVGRGGVESGLEEAVLHLHKGDIAEIIIPSHLAHGLIGDGRRINTRKPIVYRVKIIENQSNNN